ncbi:hypothetical protein IJG44_04000 [bacterium]|nr:hypothetical protein [bacterium]
MKKFLVLGLVLFGFSMLSANPMTYNVTWVEAQEFCEARNLTVATSDQLTAWGGSNQCFWTRGAGAIKPSSREWCKINIMDKLAVRCVKLF